MKSQKKAIYQKTYKSSSIYISSHHEVTVYRALCVVDYNSECVKLKLCDGIAIINGNKLGMKCFSEHEIRIGGDIISVELA